MRSALTLLFLICIVFAAAPAAHADDLGTATLMCTDYCLSRFPLWAVPACVVACVASNQIDNVIPIYTRDQPKYLRRDDNGKIMLAAGKPGCRENPFNPGVWLKPRQSL